MTTFEPYRHKDLLFEFEEVSDGKEIYIQALLDGEPASIGKIHIAKETMEDAGSDQTYETPDSLRKNAIKELINKINSKY